MDLKEKMFVDLISRNMVNEIVNRLVEQARPLFTEHAVEAVKKMEPAVRTFVDHQQDKFHMDVLLTVTERLGEDRKGS